MEYFVSGGMYIYLFILLRINLICCAEHGQLTPFFPIIYSEFVLIHENTQKEMNLFSGLIVLFC